MLHPLYFTPLCALLLVACNANFDQRLQKEAQKFTETQCPQQPEKGTWLDSTSYQPKSRTYTFWYSLEPENERVIRANSANIHPLLVEGLKNDVSLMALKAENVNFNYTYLSRTTGDVVYETRITSKEYK